MSRYTGSRFAAARKEGNQLLTGILLGMVIGVAMAAGLAWYIMKSPSPFVNNEQLVVAKPQPKVAAPVEAAIPANQSALAAASGVADDKPRFEFYKVLTDKQDATVGGQNKPADKAQVTANKPVVQQAVPAAKETYYLQAGSFSNADDAEKLKAKLTLLDMQVSVQTVTIPDKGVWHRVRVGPYKGAEEMNKVRSTLKQNGVDATPMRGQ
jgi:cell division protein FtsN